MITLDHMEKHIRNVEAANAVELYSLLAYDVCRIAAKSRIPVVTSIWETISNHPIQTLVPYAICVREVMKKTTLFVAYTTRAAAYLDSQGVDQERIRVVYPGLDLELFRPEPRNHDGRKLRILYVGRLDREKGLGEVLMAFASLCKRRGDTELWIRAKQRSGTLARMVSSFQSKLPIRLVGPMPYEHLPRLYSACDIFCMPSRDRFELGLKVWEEQFGYALMEAMACGLPIVSTDCGAIREVIGEHNSFVPQYSVDALEETLIELLDDKDKRYRLGGINRQIAQRKFDVRKQALALEAALQSAMEM